MEGIQAAINLYDGMSTPLLAVNNALNTVIGSFESTQAVSANAIDASAIAFAREQLALAERSIDGVTLGLNETANQQDQFNQRVCVGSDNMGKLKNMMMGAVTSCASFQNIEKAMDLSDTLTQTTARLNMMNDGMQTTEQIQDSIYAAAQRSRGQYTAMADAVSKMGLMAGKAFSSNSELIAFNEQLSKQFAISGTSSEGISAAMLQLTQAMGSGVLRGEELNSVFDQAPKIIQSIAAYLDVPIAQIRKMAQEGQLTADVVKSAMLSTADETNAKFESMPLTFAQIGNKIQNQAFISFQPVLDRIGEMADSERFDDMVSAASEGIALLADMALNAFEVIADVGWFVYDNWSIISPIFYGAADAVGIYIGAMLWCNVVNGIAAFSKSVHNAALARSAGLTFTATAAQHGFNAALLACPLTWIVVGVISIIAAIYAVVAAYNKWTGSTYSATGLICGIFMSALAFVGNLFIGLINTAIDIFAVLWNFIASFGDFFANVFDDPVGSIARLFFGLADTVLGILQALAGAIDTVFGTELASGVQGWRDDLGGWVDGKFGKGTEVNEKIDPSDMHLKRFEYNEAFDLGYDFGEGVDSKISDFFSKPQEHPYEPPPFNYDGYGGMDTGSGVSNLEQIADDTSTIKDSVSVTNEELTYLREIAEKEAVNRFTTAEIKIDMKNNNMINSKMDIDGVVDHLESELNRAMQTAKEGV